MDSENFLPLTKELQKIITPDQAWHYKLVPKASSDQNIEFYIDQDYNTEIKNELEILFGKKIFLLKTNKELINKTLGKYYRKSKSNSEQRHQYINYNNTEDFLPLLIDEAKNLGSSDIHIEVYEEKCRIRIRIDGLLIERYLLNKSDYPALINKIKIKSNLDISEKRLPQDGRIYFNSGTNKFDIRVSILPTLHGEKIVLRILNNDATNIDINELGFSPLQLNEYLEGIKKPHGIVLISGPTGSGKTTTLYATLKILNKEKTNILTIEDPIEYTLEGINQVQLKESIGLTFSQALRTFLRQDPDVIMLGEIRDGETAQMAIRAALTGHLVLSTIHTNSAWGTISRLIDMGVPPYLLANTINTSVAQRLIRLLCPNCKEITAFNPKLFPSKFIPSQIVENHYISKGCDHCFYTGYKGRKAIYEVIPIDFTLSESIKNQQFNIDDILKSRNVETLSEIAFRMFKSGLTSIDEVFPILLNNY